MEVIKTMILWMVRILVAAMLSSLAHADTVIQCPLKDAPLSQRWEWAVKEASARNLTNGFWIGYSIQRWMGGQEYFVTGTHIQFDSVRRNGSPSLEEVLTGKKDQSDAVEQSDDQKVKQEAKSTLEDLENSKKPAVRVRKDIAILFEFISLKPSEPDDFAMLNTSLHMELKKRPLLWLGIGDEDQSIALMEKMYQTLSSKEVKEDLLYSIASHENAAKVFPFLRDVALGTSPDNFREAAAQAIGSCDYEEAIPMLVQLSKTDRSSEVREAALNGLADMNSVAARAALIDLAKSAKDPELREETVHRVSDNATQKDIAIIQGIAMNDPNEEVQEAALYALADLPDSTSMIIDVARKHPNSELREAAMHALADNASDEAVAALQEIARNDSSEDLQEEAMYALVDLPHGKGIPILVNIAKSHPNKEMRLRAVEILGDSDSKEAKDALLKLVGDN
jgi:HEAT repeats